MLKFHPCTNSEHLSGLHAHIKDDDKNFAGPFAPNELRIWLDGQMVANGLSEIDYSSIIHVGMLNRPGGMPWSAIACAVAKHNLLRDTVKNGWPDDKLEQVLARCRGTMFEVHRWPYPCEYGCLPYLLIRERTAIDVAFIKLFGEELDIVKGWSERHAIPQRWVGRIEYQLMQAVRSGH